MKKTTGKPQPFGAAADTTGVNFALQVPAGKKCELLLYREGRKKPEFCVELPEEDGIGEVRFLRIEDIEPEKYEYHFMIGGRPYLDPYVRELSGKKIFGKKYDKETHPVRGKLVTREYDWEGDRRLHIPWNEVIAYSLHVRGFTKHTSSKAAHKGTYLGVTEKLPYLKELGINQIQCMPVYEFDECAEAKINYWGYGPAYYFAPKSAYAAGDSAVRELKDMVKACHRAGIEVVLEMPFVQGVSAHMVIECLRFYMMEYHVDGFVVNPYNVPWDILQSDPFLKDIKIMRKDDAFQNVMRRFLKGDENMINDVIQALRHNSSVDGKCNYITTHTGFTLWDLVSYDGKHNEANGEDNTDGPDHNYSWNCGAEGPSRKRDVMSLRKSQVKNAFFLLLGAQGTPCILAGDEFYNSQKGNNNVYCQDNETGWVDWGRLKTDDSLFRYVKSLIAFRRKYPCLHRAEELRGIDRTACGVPDVSYHGENAWQVRAEVSSRQLGVMYSGGGVGGGECFIAYNMHWLPHVYAVPSPGKDKKWELIADAENGLLETAIPLKDAKKIEVAQRSITVLVSREDKKKPKSRRGAKKSTEKGGEQESHESA